MKEIYEKIQRGEERITDEELETAIQTLEPVEKTLKDMGPTFYLAWREIYFLLEKLNSWKCYRTDKTY